MNCQYCNKIYSSKSSLNNHQKTAKFCIKLQNTNTNTIFDCSYCKKNFTSKYNLSLHLNICKNQTKYNIKKEEEYEDQLEKQKEEYKEQLQKQKEEYKEQLEKQKEEYKEQLEKQKEEYKEQLEKQEHQIKELQQTIERIVNKAIERPTTTNTTNNTLNISSSIDFNDVDKVKNIIEDKLDIRYVIDGQKGIANFIKDNILTDDNGELIYVCTDPSRGVFKFKDTTGELKKDLEAKKLTSYILEGGINKKSAVIGNEWCKDDTGEFDMKKFTILMVPQQSIMNLSQDNNILKRELASLTS